MKKLLITLSLIVSSLIASAQIFQIGAKSNIEKNFIINSINIPNTKFISSYCYSYGVNFKYYPNPKTYYDNGIYGLSVELLLNNSRQTYTRLDTNLEQTTYDFKNIDIPIMLHSKNQDWGLYGEIGIDYSRNISININNKNSYPMKFKKDIFYGIVGFGFDNEITRSKILTIGARGYYPLTDMTENINGYSNYKKLHIPRAGLVVGFMWYINYYHNNH